MNATYIKLPKVGDPCCADLYGNGDFRHGIIIHVDLAKGLAYSGLSSNFYGAIPTEQQDGVWTFEHFEKRIDTLPFFCYN